jgi:hypothetical protein
MKHIAGLRIESRKRFIHEQNTGLRSQGARNGYPLPHPSGKLVNVTIAKAIQMDELQILLGALPAYAASQAHHVHAKLDILTNRKPGKQTMLLKDENAIRSRPGYHLVIHVDLAVSGKGQTGNKRKERRFAASGWPYDTKELSGLNIKINITERNQTRSLANLETLLDAAQPNAGRRGVVVEHMMGWRNMQRLPGLGHGQLRQTHRITFFFFSVKT